MLLTGSLTSYDTDHNHKLIHTFQKDVQQMLSEVEEFLKLMDGQSIDHF
jgi:hypothetical protein